MNKRLLARTRGIWRRHLRGLLAFILIFASFRSAIADWNDVPTGSMKPSILEGDRIFVNHAAYGLKLPFTSWYLLHWSAPARGEIVVFISPADGLRLVKRVVGLPGDVVQMIDNRLTINGQPMQYDPLDHVIIDEMSSSERNQHGYAAEGLGKEKHPVMSTPSLHAMRSFGPLKVPAGEYFMMGDNRDNSSDSRYIGTVPLDQIQGRSSYVVMSLNYDNYFLPRMERFLKKLD